MGVTFSPHLLVSPLLGKSFCDCHNWRWIGSRFIAETLFNEMPGSMNNASLNWLRDLALRRLVSFSPNEPPSIIHPHPSPSIPILDTWLPTFNATVSGRARLPHLLPSPQRRQRRQSQCHHGRRGGAGRIQRIHLGNLENWRDKYIYIPWLESLKAT